MKKTYGIIGAIIGGLFAALPAFSQSPPFSAYSIATLGGNCVDQGAVPYQIAPGTTLCTAGGIDGQAMTLVGGVPTWTSLAGAGSVTSVALSLPTEFTVTGSPITASGTLTGTWASQSANLFLASPDGLAGAPVFRGITTGDLPTIPVAKGGTGASVASGTSLDNITGFSGTGLMRRTGAGTYTFGTQVSSSELAAGAAIANIGYTPQQVAGTYADIATTSFSASTVSIALSGYAASGDYGAGCIMVHGNSMGPMAVQDTLSQWWQLSTPQRAECWGFNPDGVSNNTPRWTAFTTWLGTNDGALNFQAGSFVFKGAAPMTLAQYQDFTLTGSGKVSTTFAFEGLHDGFVWTRNRYSTVNLADFSVTTDQIGGYKALSFLEGETCSAITQQTSTFRNLQILGADGQNHTMYWDYDIYAVDFTDVDLYAVDRFGDSGNHGVGTYFSGNAANNCLAIVVNDHGGYIQKHDTGWLIGDWQQGITISQANFQNNNRHIYAPATSTNITQLAVVNSQLGYNHLAGVDIQSAVLDLNFDNNLHICDGNDGPSPCFSATDGGSGWYIGGSWKNRVGVTPTQPLISITGNSPSMAGRIEASFSTANTVGTGPITAARVNTGGTGYGVSLTGGTMTWAGANCTVNPVLTVSTNANGQIQRVTGIATPGTCSVQPPSTATTWTPGGGLSAGSGAKFTTQWFGVMTDVYLGASATGWTVSGSSSYTGPAVPLLYAASAQNNDAAFPWESNSSAEKIAFANGGTYYTSQDVSRIIGSNTAIASTTIVLPVAVKDYQQMTYQMGGAITALNFTPAVNGWTNGSASPQYASFTLRWNASNDTWYLATPQ